MDLTRKQALTGLAGILATGVAPAAFVRSMVGARGAAFGSAVGGVVPTAADYIKDGLIAMWDGIENGGYGVHLDVIDRWTDLTGAYNLTKYGNFDVAKDHIENLSSDSCFYTDELDASAVLTYEAVAQNVNLNSNECYYIIGNTRTNGSLANFYIAKINRLNFLSGYPNGNDNGYGVIEENASSLSIRSVSFTKGSSTAIYSGAETSMANARWSPWSNTHKITLFRNFMSAANSTSRIYNIRLYSRSLTTQEKMKNYAIDKARFGLT